MDITSLGQAAKKNRFLKYPKNVNLMLQVQVEVPVGNLNLSINWVHVTQIPS